MSPPRLLVVDDVESNRLLVRNYLAGFDLELIEAASGGEALTVCSIDRPALVLMDVRMQGMSGIEATESLKANAELTGIAVVAYTASAMKEEEERMAEVFDGHLIKPASKTDVIRELMKHLPYQIEEEIPEAAPVTVSTSDWTPDLLTREKRDQLADLVPVLESEIDHWEELRRTLTINEIEIFASRIQEFSDDTRLPPA